eukprot:12848513-Ditylum_brightwellii.AAC.1
MKKGSSTAVRQRFFSSSLRDEQRNDTTERVVGDYQHEQSLPDKTDQVNVEGCKALMSESSALTQSQGPQNSPINADDSCIDNSEFHKDDMCTASIHQEQHHRSRMTVSNSSKNDLAVSQLSIAVEHDACGENICDFENIISPFSSESQSDFGFVSSPSTQNTHDVVSINSANVLGIKSFPRARNKCTQINENSEASSGSPIFDSSWDDFHKSSTTENDWSDNWGSFDEAGIRKTKEEEHLKSSLAAEHVMTLKAMSEGDHLEGKTPGNTVDDYDDHIFNSPHKHYESNEDRSKSAPHMRSAYASNAIELHERNDTSKEEMIPTRQDP